MSELIIINFVIFTAFFLKGLAGFGNSLINNGGLAFIRENKFITPVDTMLGLPVNIYLLIQEWKYIRFRIALPLLLAVGAGIVPGIYLLDTVNDRILKSILAVVLLVISLDFFRSGKKEIKKETKYIKLLVLSAGFFSGILTSLYGIGVLIPAVMSRTGLNKRDFRGSICFIFTAESIMRITGYIYKGIIDMDIFMDILSLIPAAAAGVALSRIADKKADDNMIRKIVITVILFSAVLLLVKNRFGLV